MTAINNTPRAVVIGCGIIGLSSAIRLLEQNFNVTIIAREIPPNTTSDVAAAIWYPYKAYPEDRVLDWSSRTLEEYYNLMNDSGTGIYPVTFTEYLGENVPDPWWKNAVKMFRFARQEELIRDYPAGYIFEVPFVESPIYMKWLMNRFKSLNGKLIQEEVKNLSRLTENYDLIVNCSGNGAADLVGDDDLHPVRGQALKVRASGSGRYLLDQTGPLSLCYVLPRSEDYVLGGTSEDHIADPKPDPVVFDEILRKCKLLDPELECHSILEHAVGFRPARSEVRLEAETMDDDKLLIHNYGHGGAGFTLAWGCADEVLQIAKRML